MTRLLSFVVSLLIASSVSAQVDVRVEWMNTPEMNASDMLFYDFDRKLVWNDFKGPVPNQTGKMKALTTSGFGYHADFSSSTYQQSKQTQVVVKVYCYFRKYKSWVLPGAMRNDVLNHEQRHFDISFIAANRFIDQLRTADIPNWGYDTEINEIYKECVQWMNDMQGNYDNDAGLISNTTEQSKWDQHISDLLLKIRG